MKKEEYETGIQHFVLACIFRRLAITRVRQKLERFGENLQVILSLWDGTTDLRTRQRQELETLPGLEMKVNDRELRVIK